METCTVLDKIEWGTKDNPIKKVVMMVSVDGTEKQLGPFPPSLVCDICVGDTFEWDGQHAGTITIIKSGALVIPEADQKTDWAAELTAIHGLRTKALNELFALKLPEAGITFDKTDYGHNRAKWVQGFLLIGADTLQQADLPEHLEPMALIQVMVAIEKALAGRANP
jgi:hypothetical protein